MIQADMFSKEPNIYSGSFDNTEHAGLLWGAYGRWIRLLMRRLI